jgi:phosphocarrier protein
MSERACVRDSSLGNRSPDAAPIIRVLEICNKKGLHARASAKFVQTVEKFDAEVKVKRGNETVGGTSIMGLMMLAAGIGCEIEMRAEGPAAGSVLAALVDLIDRKFDEE